MEYISVISTARRIFSTYNGCALCVWIKKCSAESTRTTD